MSLVGVSTIAAGIALLISGACLVVFFVTKIDAWGRANDATIALFAALMIPPIFDIHERFALGSRWLAGLPALIGIAGLLVIAITSGLTAAAKLDWLLSAKIGSVAFAGFLGWMAATCLLILRRGRFPDALAWFGLGTVGIMGVTVGSTLRFIQIHGSLAGEVQPSPWLRAMFGLAFLCLTGWVSWLGVTM